ncbi:MAG: hypothetical protein ACP5GB_03350 [Candidatus Micrarchaeia archaeon]
MHRSYDHHFYGPQSHSMQGLAIEREKVNPTVGIVLNEEGKIYNLSGFYLIPL